MTDALFAGDDDANTPLDASEREGLLATWVTIRRELNEAEQANIADALRWLSRRRTEVLDKVFLRALHKRMFGDVWRWAGHYRRTGRNIGIEPYRIPGEVAAAVGDARYWVEAETYPADKIAVRFSHKLVFIHSFPNGNGRFSRLVGDLLVQQLGQRPFTWGRANLSGSGDVRATYVAALRAADAHDIAPLLRFARH